MFERMSGKDGVVLCKVQFDMLGQAMRFQKAKVGRRVIIILMLAWFFRLRLDKDRALETDLQL